MEHSTFLILGVKAETGSRDKEKSLPNSSDRAPQFQPYAPVGTQKAAVDDFDIFYPAGSLASDDDAPVTIEKGATLDSDIPRRAVFGKPLPSRAGLEGYAVVAHVDAAVDYRNVGAGVDIDAVGVRGVAWVFYPYVVDMDMAGKDGMKGPEGGISQRDAPDAHPVAGEKLD